MSSDEEKIRRLISEGDYWNAINLRHGTAKDKINFKILDLMDEYPSLGKDLNVVQVALTQRLSDYEQAFNVRNQIFKEVEEKYGEECLQFIPHQSIWQQIWDPATQSRDLAHPRAISQRLFKELNHAVSLLPSIRITYGEYRKGKAARIVQKLDCQKCNGTKETTCVNCHGKGKIRTTYLDILQNNRMAEKLLSMDRKSLSDILEKLQDTSGISELKEVEITCPECNGKGKARCDCVNDVMLLIPRRIKKSLVVPVVIKNKGRGDSKNSYARLEYSRSHWVFEIMLQQFAKGLALINPWSGVGQGLLFIIGVIQLSNYLISSSGSFPFLSLIKAGFQGIGQSFDEISTFIKSPSMISSVFIMPLTLDGILIIQGLIFIFLGAALFFGKIVRDMARKYQSQIIFGDPIKIWFLNTGQNITSRWVFVVFSGVNCLAGLSSIILAIFQARIGLGLVGVYSIVTGLAVVVPIIKSFFQSQE